MLNQQKPAAPRWGQWALQRFLQPRPLPRRQWPGRQKPVIPARRLAGGWGPVERNTLMCKEFPVELQPTWWLPRRPAQTAWPHQTQDSPSAEAATGGWRTVLKTPRGKQISRCCLGQPVMVEEDERQTKRLIGNTGKRGLWRAPTCYQDPRRPRTCSGLCARSGEMQDPELSPPADLQVLYKQEVMLRQTCQLPGGVLKTHPDAHVYPVGRDLEIILVPGTYRKSLSDS